MEVLEVSDASDAAALNSPTLRGEATPWYADASIASPDAEFTSAAGAVAEKSTDL